MTRKVRHPKPTPEQNAGRNIRRAAAIIENRGWIQGSDGYKEVGFCMRGALRYAVPATEDYSFNYEALQNWLSNIYGPGTMIVGYNDTPGRTKEEVLLTMRKCADELDPGIRPRETYEA